VSAVGAGSGEGGFALEVLPIHLQFAPSLGNSAAADSKLAGCALGGLPGGQRRRDSTFLLGQAVEPVGDVDSGGRGIGGAGLANIESAFNKKSAMTGLARQPVPSPHLAERLFENSSLLQIGDPDRDSSIRTGTWNETLARLPDSAEGSGYWPFTLPDPQG
jgi:hypothetical protein